MFLYLKTIFWLFTSGVSRRDGGGGGPVVDLQDPPEAARHGGRVPAAELDACALPHRREGVGGWAVLGWHDRDGRVA